MGYYHTHILPRLTHWVCAGSLVRARRQKIVSQARGRVLEVGLGSGLNLPFYHGSQVQELWGIDPCPQLLQMAAPHIRAASFGVILLNESAEQIPLPDQSMDTVLVTYTLCSIPDVHMALEEIHRVLKPGGKLLFCEHGSAPEPWVKRWQNQLNPAWNRVSGGCNLNRPIADLIAQSGFKLTDLEMGYISPLKILSFNYQGSAQKR